MLLNIHFSLMKRICFRFYFHLLLVISTPWHSLPLSCKLWNSNRIIKTCCQQSNYPPSHKRFTSLCQISISRVYHIHHYSSTQFLLSNLTNSHKNKLFPPLNPSYDQSQYDQAHTYIPSPCPTPSPYQNKFLGLQPASSLSQQAL